MRWLLLRLLPRRAAAQMACIVTVSLGLVLLATAGALALLLPRELSRQPSFPYITEAIILAHQYQAARSPDVREAVLETMLASNPRLLRLEPAIMATLPPPGRLDRILIEGLQPQVGPGARVFTLHSSERSGPPAIGLHFPDQLTLTVSPPPRTAPPGGFAFIFALVAMLGLVVILIGWLSLWATREVASPLSRLAAAADRFSLDRDEPLLADHGPIEVKRLAAAFGAMAERVRRLVEERTRMLAAVSHDLRTPITRLRLRAEEIEDPGKRLAIIADLALMERMTSAALAYLRDGRTSSKMTATDIPALLQTICDDFADFGHVVVYNGPLRASAALCDADQIMRAVTNLVDNAIKFGGKAIVQLDDSDPARIAIIVEDEGPGIAAGEREKVLEPFYRSDLARTLGEDSGFGLGLAIVRTIIEGHRGGLTLEERPGGGLSARIAWPRR